VVEHFPFEGDGDRAAWLAGALTPIGWALFDGPSPGILVDAPARDVGKTSLASLGCLIATGCPPARRSWPLLEEEQAKVLTTIAGGGGAVALLDNVRGSLGGAALDAYLTSGGALGGYVGRALGTNSDIEADRVPMLWVTGNNVQLHADTVRRLLSVRLVWKGARPAGERQGLPPLPTAAGAPALWALAATILRAWVLAGRPVAKLPAMGSFEAWSASVRAAVQWVSKLDPCASRARLQHVDREQLEHAAVVAALRGVFDVGQAWTVRDVVQRVTPPATGGLGSAAQDLRDALLELGAARKGGDVDAVLLGHRLRRLADAPDPKGYAIVRANLDRKGVASWQIKRLEVKSEDW
jgi:putative DNA primase/helicase